MVAKHVPALLFLLLSACGAAEDGLTDGESVEEDAFGATSASITAGDYVIRAVHSGKCLDIQSASTQDGAPVQQWDCNGTPAQVFRVIPLGNGYVQLLNPNSNRSLDVREVSTADGALLQQWGYGGGANQQFEVFDAGNGQYGISARHSGKMLDIKDVSTANGAPVQQWTWAGSTNQRWTFQKIGGGGGGGGGWNLVFSDEFNGANGAAIDGSRWSAEIGGNGWGNAELQYYTNSTSNARQENGSLVITATPQGANQLGCWYGTCQYTSARLVSRGKFETTYGRVEARIKVPRGQGLWPAFWMLGNDIGSVGWPSCGEIDIMENVGKDPARLHGTLHGPGYSGGNPLTGSTTLPNGAPLADDYHVYGVEWEPSEIRWYLDGALYLRKTPADAPPGTSWVFNHNFFMILNVAVGGNWPGSPDGSTSFPQQMLVDYVRVYHR
ncbi:RICIN domain-containing protein [Chondromyces apiculatus]|uniref:Endo-1,4-beta-xylanase A n=1 Tax=Chondromyces apiculatus DSM 436 TaxID=1192034 RepID=A0A017TCZ5_9BACT|nr:RICIN domain-containing protein [Chondromyces apiculatus]EYF07084.1 Endo-1,4-beta-xylanase A precursor [Chondromyces apiculatus DSM 436]